MSVLLDAIAIEKAVDRKPRDGDEEAIRNLSLSMQQTGRVLQPIVVEDLVEKGKGYRLLFGRRRVAAAKLLGWTHIDARICDELDQETRRQVIAIENMQRRDLTPNEEAIAVIDLAEAKVRKIAKARGIADADNARAWTEQALLDRADVREAVIAEVSAALGQSITWVRDRLYLRRLHQDVRGWVHEGKLPIAHAREIAKLPPDEFELQIALAQSNLVDEMTGIAGDLRQLREDVRRRVFVLAEAPWKLDVPIDDAPACIGCKHNSSSQPHLFEHGGEASKAMVNGMGSRFDFADVETKAVSKSGACLSPSCYAKKLAATKREVNTVANKIVEAALQEGPRSGIVERAMSAAKPAALKIAKPAALRDRVKDRALQKSAADPERLKASAEQAEAERKWRERRNLMQRCEGKRQEATVRWIKEVNAELEKRVIRTPMLFTGLKMLQHTQAARACSPYQLDKRVAAAAKSGLNAVAALACNPTPENLAKLEHECHRRFEYFSPDDCESDVICAAVAKALSLQVPPMPVVEDFMPDELKKEIEAERQAAIASKQAKKGSKG